MLLLQYTLICLSAYFLSIGTVVEDRVVMALHGASLLNSVECNPVDWKPNWEKKFVIPYYIFRLYGASNANIELINADKQKLIGQRLLSLFMKAYSSATTERQ
jgi:hypothetical protein